jgi:dienelactone hydrolase
MLWRDDVKADAELHPVKMVRDKLVDSIRGNRVIPVKMYYPVTAELTNIPLIIWSHGLGGSIDGAAFLSRFIASHGYAVVHVQHLGTDSSLWEGKPGHPWDIIKDMTIPRSATLARFADVPFVLDQLPEWINAHEEIAGRVDFKAIGMSGHSFGAMTTQVMLGQEYPDEQGMLQDYSDMRFKAGILYSPVPTFYLKGNDNVYGAASSVRGMYNAISRPLFHMTGTDDSSPVEGFDFTKRLAVYEESGEAEKMLMILKDGDHMIYNGSRGKLGQNPNREKHETIIKIAALAYWDAKLKSDPAAQEWLINGGFATYLGSEAEFRYES